MKIAGLIIGILLLVVSGIGFIVCLLLPTITSNKVSFEESLFGLIPSVLIFFLALIITIVSAIFFFKGRKKAA